MEMPTDKTAAPNPNFRWFHLTPGRLLIVLLVVEAVLLFSERFQWFTFNEKKGWTVLIVVAAVGVLLLLMLLWFIISLIFRWRFQFSIRSLLVLTVAVAIPFSWLGVEMKQAREQRKIVEALVKLGGSVKYHSQFNSSGILYQTVEILIDQTVPQGPAWLRKVLGDDFFGNVTFIDLAYSKVTDVDLEHLKGLKQLQWLGLDCTQVSDAGLECLKGINQLQYLFLNHTQITDGGLDRLKELNQLQLLYIQHTKSPMPELPDFKRHYRLSELSDKGDRPSHLESTANSFRFIRFQNNLRNLKPKRKFGPEHESRSYQKESS